MREVFHNSMHSGLSHTVLSFGTSAPHHQHFGRRHSFHHAFSLRHMGMILALLFALPVSAQTITQQPLPQTVAVGQSATFSAQASVGNCSVTVFKTYSTPANGIDVGGTRADANGNVTYSTPATTTAYNGAQYFFRFFNCPNLAGHIDTNTAALTVVKILPLAITGTFVYENDQPVTGPLNNLAIFEGSVQVGTITIDAVGNLSGSVTPDATQGSILTFSVGVPGFFEAGQISIPTSSFLHSSTGVAIHVILFKSDMSVKSAAVALTP